MARNQAILVMLAAAAFALSFGVRMRNAPVVLNGDVPQVAPYDEMYHLKRMTVSAAHFPAVLEFDRDRGEGGAWVPWPPLYDLAAGGAARLLGATEMFDVLRTVIWFPPLVFSLFLAAFVLLAGRTMPLAASAAAIAIATAPHVVTSSWLGAIDHHFLEPILVLAILGATLRRNAWLLALALTAALFVQTALLVACALAFVVLFFFSDGRAGSFGFALAWLAVSTYRFSRPDGFPDGPWFLGWLHAGALAAAAVALFLLFKTGRRWIALLGGALVLLVHPGVVSSLMQGAGFFRGDPWLDLVVEFQPAGPDLLWPMIGALLLLFPAMLKRELRPLVIFAAAYVVAAMARQRFAIVAIPLLALAAASYAHLLDGRKRLIAALLVALPSVLSLGYLWQYNPRPPVTSAELPWLRIAGSVRGQRVLAPWSYGHLLDVAGGAQVMIDNFGTMPDRDAFVRAQQAFLVTDEAALARYCDAHDVRFVALEPPDIGLLRTAAAIGATVDDPRKTWWWRVYETQPRETPLFRLVRVEEGITLWERKPTRSSTPR